MNAEFNWWLLIVGLVAGAGLVWLVIADWSRRDEDLAQDERSAESAWISQVLQERGMQLDPGDAEQVLELHRAYLRHLGGLGLDDGLPEGDPGDVDQPTLLPDPETPSAQPAPTGPTTPPAPTTQEPAWLHTAPESDAPLAGDPTNDPGPDPNAVPWPAADLDRGSVRARPMGPRGGAGMDAEPPRPS